MNDHIPAARDAALAFIKGINAGVLASAGHDNLPHATVIHFISDDAFNIYFLTKKDSRKFAAIQAHPQVAFVIGRADIPQSLQIEGVASEIVNDESAQSRIDELMNVLATHVPGYVPVAKNGRRSRAHVDSAQVDSLERFSTSAIGNDNLLIEIPVQS